MVGKKNIECRVLAINKGEIVKRIIYQNPDADFLFCVGDDKVSPIPATAMWIQFVERCSVDCRPTRTCTRLLEVCCLPEAGMPTARL